MNRTIEQMLKNYKHNKAYVEMIFARIETYKEMLKKDDLETYAIHIKGLELGMPRSPNFNKNSPVERAVELKYLDRETLKEWIKEDESRAFLKKLEVQQIEIALESLNMTERFIVTQKFFENKTWKSIEISYSKNMGDYMTTEKTLWRINKNALRKLEKLLAPLLQR